MKNKFLGILIPLISLAGIASAQSRIDKYCQVLVGNPNYKLYVKKTSARISLGERRELFAPRDTTLLAQLRKVDSLTTETDVLNYMSELGWSLVNIHAIADRFEVLYFKKEFNREEFVR